MLSPVAVPQAPRGDRSGDFVLIGVGRRSSAAKNVFCAAERKLIIRPSSV
jgi:hypothetical protein